MLKKYGVECAGAGFILGTVIGVLCYTDIFNTISCNVNHFELGCRNALWWSFVLLCTLLGAGVSVFLIRARSYSLLIIIFICVVFGMFHSAQYIYFKPKDADIFIGKKVTVRGFISDKPDERENSVRLIIAPLFIRGQNREIKNSGDVLVIAPRFGGYEYGDEISLSGVLKKPENIVSEDGRIFDYEKYLLKDNILYQMVLPKIIGATSTSGFSLKNSLYSIREKFINSLSSTISEPEVSLAGGILLGEKRSLGKDLQDDFRIAGLIHIVVLSGYNVSIIAMALMFVLRKFSKKLSVIVGIFSIILFAIMVGGGATVIRSAVMACFSVFSPVMKGKYDVLRALTLTAVGMTILNPLTPALDTSFQLSFMATLGLIFFSDPIREICFKKVTEKFGLRDILTSTFAAQFSVSPLILYTMGQFSVIAPITNILVLPTMPFAMFATGVTGLIGLVSPLLALPFSWMSYGVLHYVLVIVENSAKIPFASLHVPQFSFIWILISYAVIFTVMKFATDYTNRHKSTN
ncbi:MAG: ComEC/Rec2 family competence protein [bacterium]